MARSILMHARIWRRIAAFITDALLVGLVCFLLLAVSGTGPQSLGELTAFTPSTQQIAVSTYFALFLFIYHLFSEYIVGQTLGMLLWGIFVTQEDKPKESLLRFGQAFVRNLFLFPLVPGIVQLIIWIADLGHYAFVGKRLSETATHTNTVEYR